jgi:hypothetical protein
LQRVHEAFERARKTRCVSCRHKGGTIQCHKEGCNNVYHYECALDNACVFVGDFDHVYCAKHKKEATAEPPPEPVSF